MNTERPPLPPFTLGRPPIFSRILPESQRCAGPIPDRAP